MLVTEGEICHKKEILKKGRGSTLPPLLLMQFTEGATFHFTLKPAQALVKKLRNMKPCVSCPLWVIQG